MGFTGRGAGLYRVLALPAARLSLVCAAGVIGVGLFAGAVRVLPLLMGAGLPLRVGAPLARAALGVSLEAGLFVGPPLAWALASASLVDRGEARALFALGIRPLRIVASAWPALLALALAAALGSLVWATEAAAPGRLARALVADVRSACASAASSSSASASTSAAAGNSAAASSAASSSSAAPNSSASAAPSNAVAYDVPSLGFSWVCFPNDEPRLIGPAPFGGSSSMLSARAVDLSDDLRALELDDVSLTFSPSAKGALAGARFHVDRASIRGIAPLGRASNLTVAARTSLMALTSAILASLAALTVLSLSIKSRSLAAAIGLAGPASALMVFSTLERAPSPPSAYIAMPLSGILAIGALFAVKRFAASARSNR